MTRRWNQKQVIDEAAKELWSDGITSFRDDVIRWANEVQDDLVANLPVDEYLFKLKKALPVSREDICLSIDKPTAPTAAITQTTETINYNSTTSSNFTSSSLTSFDSTSVTLAVDTDGPAQETFYASYASDEDGIRGDGTLTGTISNGSVTGGKAILNAGGDIVYTGTSKINHRKGTIRMKYTPNYSGNPGALQAFFDFAENNAVNRDRFTVSQQTNGQIRAFYFDTAGSSQGTNDFGAWSPTAGTEYEIEISWDFTPSSEAVRVFIDGTQLGSTDNKVLTTADDITAVGHFKIGDSNSDFDIDDLQVFNEVQHTADFTGEVPRTIPVYASTDQTVSEDTGRSVGELSGFTAVTSEPTGTSVLFNLDVGGTKKWWNGSAWANSDGTSSQSNTAAVINTNAESLIDSAATIKVNAVLTNSSASDRPSLTSVTLSDKGDLVTGTEYKAYISYVVWDDNLKKYMEGEINGGSTAVTADLDNQSISLTGIPVFEEAGTNSPTNIYRRIYLAAKASGESDFAEPFYVADIEDNTTTTYTISTAPTSVVTPVSDTELDKISDKHMYFPSTNVWLRREDLNKITRFDTGGSDSTSPDFFDFLGYDRIFLYPKLSSAATVAQRTLIYWVHRRPHEFFYDVDRLVDMPITAKKALIQGIIAKGYKYRQRADWVSHHNLYEEYKNELKKRFQRKRGRFSPIRDTEGDVFGHEV